MNMNSDIIRIGQNRNMITVNSLYINNLINFIKKMASIGKIKEKYVEIMVHPDNIQYYVIAFVHKSYNKYNNYEIFEQLGDLSVNKFVVWHAYKKFPQINFPSGTAIAARIKITFGSKVKLGLIGRNLNFSEFIITNPQSDVRVPAIEDLIEDTFEAFMGATEFIFDKCLMAHTGYSFVYKMLEGIFENPHYVSDFRLDYSILTDPVTILKEMVESPEFYNIFPQSDFPQENKLVYSVSKPKPKFPENIIISTSTVFLVFINKQKMLLGNGSASTKKKSKQIAAKNSLAYLQQTYKLTIKDKYEELLKSNEEYPSHFVIGM